MNWIKITPETELPIRHCLGGFWDMFGNWCWFEASEIIKDHEGYIVLIEQKDGNPVEGIEYFMIITNPEE